LAKNVYIYPRLDLDGAMALSVGQLHEAAASGGVAPPLETDFRLG